MEVDEPCEGAPAGNRILYARVVERLGEPEPTCEVLARAHVVAREDV